MADGQVLSKLMSRTPFCFVLSGGNEWLKALEEGVVHLDPDPDPDGLSTAPPVPQLWGLLMVSQLSLPTMGLTDCLDLQAWDQGSAVS